MSGAGRGVVVVFTATASVEFGTGEFEERA